MQAGSTYQIAQPERGLRRRYLPFSRDATIKINKISTSVGEGIEYGSKQGMTQIQGFCGVTDSLKR